MKEWYIEDAGGGCRAFSEVLVLVCEQPRMVYKSYLPLSWKYGTTMAEIAHQKVMQMMQEAGVTKQDKLHVCTSNIFFELHKWLNHNGYQWEPLKIDGLAHQVAESTFNNQIFAAGFPKKIQLEERNYKDFYGAVDRWLRKDPARRRYLKNMNVRRKPDHLRYVLKGNTAKAKTCHRCQDPIAPYKPMVHFHTKRNGKSINRFFHPACTPHQPSKNKLQQAHIYWQNEILDGVILPARKPTLCMVCSQAIVKGEKTLHIHHDNGLLLGHPSCFTSTAKITKLKSTPG